MKKQYISPELDILLLESADVITASPVDGGGAGGGNLGGEFDDWG